jgi:hypothetical protein
VKASMTNEHTKTPMTSAASTIFTSLLLRLKSYG